MYDLDDQIAKYVCAWSKGNQAVNLKSNSSITSRWLTYLRSVFEIWVVSQIGPLLTKSSQDGSVYFKLGFKYIWICAWVLDNSITNMTYTKSIGANTPQIMETMCGQREDFIYLLIVIPKNWSEFKIR